MSPSDRPNACGRCRIVLDPGARHVRAEDCIEALTHYIAQIERPCEKCGVKPQCFCDVKRVARKKLAEKSPQASYVLELLGEILKPE